MRRIDKNLFVVLSDIHISEINSVEVLSRLEKFDIELKKQVIIYNPEKIFILISGDIAFSGKKSEYNLINKCFSSLSDKYKVIMTPGNHDHDFSIYEGPLREHLLSMELDKIDSNVLDIVTKGQSEYHKFNDAISNVEVSDETFLAKKYNYEDYLSITSLNTAWCSTISEQGGCLKFPISNFIKENDESYFRISFFHHPLSWLEPNNSKELRNVLRNNNDIVITGHEHIDDSFKVETESNSSLFVESISFFDENIKENGFLTLFVNNNDILVSKYIWLDNDFEKTLEKKKSEIIKTGIISSAGFHLSQDFVKKLIDTGTVFSHPDIDELSINDIFVYPNYKNLSSSKRTLDRESSEGILLKNDFENIILVGEECSGKTTLLKKLFLDAINSGSVPVFIDGNSIKKARNFQDSKLDKIIKDQYVNLTLSKIMDVEKCKILFIDNFDYIQGDSKSCGIFLDSVTKYFDKIVITVSDTYDLGESYISGNSIFDETYDKLEILKLGYRLRYELINKWNKHKPICEDSSKELLLYNDQASKTINRIIGQNYIPSTPFFLLTMLQSMDSGHASDMNTSSYGYYYQYLITSSLGLASVKKENLDEIFNYIKELSYYFYNNKLKENSFDSLWEFNTEFCSEYGLKVDCKSRLDLLVKSKILNMKDDYYSFKYPYIYYFFIAKYLSDTLEESATNNIVDNLIDTLDKRRSMSILMFLTHHSKDRSILDRIVKNSKTLFSSFSEADLGNNISFIDSIIEQLPDFYYSSTDRLELRKNYEESKDDKSAEYDSFEGEEDEEISDRDDENYDFIKELNLTFKSLELLGQLSRNYYGSLKIDQKEKLLKEAMDAPLRALEGIYCALRDEPERAIEMIESKISEQINKKNHLTPSEINNIARKLLFQLMTIVTYNIIKKVSSCIGSKNLLPVIENISNNRDSNAIKLIELSSRLDLGQYCSPSELKGLMKHMKNHRLCTVMLKSMILNYMYMFELSDKDVKQLCSIADINYKPVADQLSLDRINKR